MVASMAGEWLVSALTKRFTRTTPEPPPPDQGDGWLHTALQLDALPVKTVVQTGDGVVFQLWPEHRWYGIADRRAHTSAQVLFGTTATGSGRVRVLT